MKACIEAWPSVDSGGFPKNIRRAQDDTLFESASSPL